MLHSPAPLLLAGPAGPAARQRRATIADHLRTMGVTDPLRHVLLPEPATVPTPTEGWGTVPLGCVPHLIDLTAARPVQVCALLTDIQRVQRLSRRPPEPLLLVEASQVALHHLIAAVSCPVTVVASQTVPELIALTLLTIRGGAQQLWLGLAPPPAPRPPPALIPALIALHQAALHQTPGYPTALIQAAAWCNCSPRSLRRLLHTAQITLDLPQGQRTGCPIADWVGPIIQALTTAVVPQSSGW